MGAPRIRLKTTVEVDIFASINFDYFARIKVCVLNTTSCLCFKYNFLLIYNKKYSS